MLFSPGVGLQEVRGQVGGGDAALSNAALAAVVGSLVRAASVSAEEPEEATFMGRLLRRKFGGSSKMYVGRVIRETDTGWTVAYEDGDVYDETDTRVAVNSQAYDKWFAPKAKPPASWPPLENQREALGVVAAATAGGGDCLIHATHRPHTRPQADEELAHPCPDETRSALADRLAPSEVQRFCGITDAELRAAELALSQPGAALGGIAIKLLAHRFKRHIVVLNWADGAAGIFTPDRTLPQEWYGRAGGAIIAPNLDWLVAWMRHKPRRGKGLTLKAPKETPIIVSYDLEGQHFTAEMLPGQVVSTPPPTPPRAPSPEGADPLPGQATPAATPAPAAPSQQQGGSAGKSPASLRRERRNAVVIPDDYPALRVEEVDGKTCYFCPFATCLRGKPGAKGYGSKGAAETHMKDHVLKQQDAAAQNGSQPQPGQAQPAKPPPARIPTESWQQLAGKDVPSLLAPRGQATIAFIPRGAQPAVGAALNQALDAACAPGISGECGAVALALTASLTLGVTYVDNQQPVEQGVFNKVASRKRTAHIVKQANMVLRGDFNGALEAANARDGLSAQARKEAFARAASFRKSQHSAGARPGGALLSQKQKRKIHNLIKVGELSRALAVLSSSDPAKFDEATFNRIRKLLPDVEEELTALGVDLPAAAECDEDTLCKVIRKLKRLVAPGPSGLTNDHIKALFDTESEAGRLAMQPLLRFVNAALAGKLNTVAVDYLTASTLVALYKPDGEGGLKMVDGLPDIRPIAVPETLYRIAALCGLELVKDTAVRHLVDMQQLGVSVPCGAEAIATAVRLYLDKVYAGGDGEEAAEPLLRCVVKADMSNAFSCISRSTMMQAVKDVAPGLARFVFMAYSKPARLVLANHGPGDERFHVFLSKTGVRQGDPLGPLLYALTAAVAMKQVRMHYLSKGEQPPIALSFADDINGLICAANNASLEAKVDEFVTILRDSMSAVNVSLNRSTSVYSRQPGAVNSLTCDIGIDTNGAKILGAPIGNSEYVQTKARKRLRASFEQMLRIPELETTEAIKLLRVCINQRPLFLACVSHAEDFVPVAEEWDAAMQTCLQRICQMDQLNRRWFLKGDGGLGITELAAEAPSLRYRRYIQTKLTILECLPGELSDLITFDRDSEHPYHEEVFRSYDALPPPTQDIAMAPEEDPRDLPQPDADPDQPNNANAPPLLSMHKVVHAHLGRITESLNAVAREKLLSALPSEFSDRAKLQLLQSSEPGASHWIRDFYIDWRAVMPTYARARYATALWMGDDIRQLAGSADPSGRSILHRAHHTERHQWLLSLLCDIARECGGTAHIKGACAIFGDSRMIDVVIKLPRSGKLFAVDVTVVDGATESYVDQPDLFVNVTRGVKEAEEKKLAFYHDCPDTHELVAFAVGYQIELGDGARSFVHELATELAYKQSAGSDEPTDAAIRRATRCIMQRTGCCIMRSNAAIIETSQNKGGAVPGHTAANSVKHSSWKHGEGVYPASRGW